MKTLRWLVPGLVLVAAAMAWSRRLPALNPPAVPSEKVLNAEVQGKAAVVLIFIGRDCPISNAYIPEIDAIRKADESRSIATYVVYADSDATPAIARRHAREYHLSCPFLLDPQRTLVRFTGATVTPEAVVLSPNRKVLYRGRIDDQFTGLGQSRQSARSHDLRDALDAVTAGKPVAHPFHPAVGCFISEPQP